MLDLFGGSLKWKSAEWTSSDDRVRGGSSQVLHISPMSKSYLKPQAHNTACFYGNLNTTTLGGAGFASQRTANNVGPWNFEKHDGIVINVEKGDNKIYTLILKDTLLPRDENGREQSTISWEYSFQLNSSETHSDGQTCPDVQDQTEEKQESDVQHPDCSTFIPWAKFQPFYRGRPNKDKATKLNLTSVKRISIMMRSHFDKQSGPFKIVLGGMSLTTLDEWKDEKKRLSESHDDGWVFLAVEEYVDGGAADSRTSGTVSGDEVIKAKSWCILM